jgi:hypothetical protein
VTSIDPGDGGNYAPAIDPARFTAVVDNEFLPFLPGMKWVYRGINDEGDEETTATEVLPDERTVMGVQVTVVHDVVTVGGVIIEDTMDWYAQDDQGNVWYFGEDTTAYDSDGSTSKEGSWEAGVDGALPGIVMPANPQPAATGYRQEFLKGSAEDMATVVAVDATVTADKEYQGVLVTNEWTPLEPGIVEQKSYAPGVGLVSEEIVRGGQERIGLVEFTPVA